MEPVTTDPVQPVAPGPRAVGVRGAPRVAVAVGLVVVGSAILARSPQVRALEARVTAAITGFVLHTDTLVDPDRGSFWWGQGTDREFGLRITPACSSGYVVGPLAIGLGLLALIKRLPTTQVALAAAVSFGIVLAVNIGRVVLIAASQQRWGTDVSFWWSHVVAGSILAVVGDAAALAAAVRLTFGGSGRRAGPLH